jgi:hypothetical protein
MTVYVWEKPAKGVLKCNVDTACYCEQNCTVLELVLGMKMEAL